MGSRYDVKGIFQNTGMWQAGMRMGWTWDDKGLIGDIYYSRCFYNVNNAQ